MSSGPIYSGIAAAILTPLILGWVVDRTRGVKAGRDGWRRLRPGGGIVALILACAAFSLLCFYVYLFVGSARADAAKQMLYCVSLAFAFGFGAIALTFAAYWRNVAWQGRLIQVTTPTGFERVARIDDIVAIDYSNFRSMFQIHFADGWRVEASPYMHGTGQLLGHIDRLMPAGVQPPIPDWEADGEFDRI